MTFIRFLVVFTLAFVVGCGDDDVVEIDAAVDAEMDSGRDAGSDAGPECPLDCELGDTCCFGDDGEPVCVDLDSDLAHCGRCGLACTADRGTECREGLCACGRLDIGCEGDRGSLCCPAREDRPIPYCADLLTDGINCGGCGVACDPTRSSECQAGECTCGEERRTCGETEQCCAPLGGASFTCVDVMTDRMHCGACERRCRAGEDCVEGGCRSRLDAGVDAGVDAGGV